MSKKNLKVCLVGSSGGHLTHLYMLKPFWENKDRFWVTFDKQDGAGVHNGLMKNSGFIGSYIHFSLAHL